jgi:hypothetical protein
VKVNFKRFKSPAEVRDFLKKQLAIGVATPDDVFTFLDDLGLRHSELFDNSRSFGGRFNSSGNLEVKPFLSLYEQHITSGARARSTLFIFSNQWMLFFHFNSGKLAEIEVEKVDVSF